MPVSVILFVSAVTLHTWYPHKSDSAPYLFGVPSEHESHYIFDKLLTSPTYLRAFSVECAVPQCIPVVPEGCFITAVTRVGLVAESP